MIDADVVTLNCLMSPQSINSPGVVSSISAKGFRSVAGISDMSVQPWHTY